MKTGPIRRFEFLNLDRFRPRESPFFPSETSLYDEVHWLCIVKVLTLESLGEVALGVPGECSLIAPLESLLETKKLGDVVLKLAS